MKLTLAVIVSLLTLVGCGSAGHGLDSGEEALLDPERVYEVDGWGTNPDIYEFTPVGHDHMSCLIVVSGGDKASGITCFPKK